MNQLFDFRVPVADMHQYPIGTQHLYCFQAEAFKYGLLSMNAIERTYLAENKQYWREVAKANIKTARRDRANIQELHDALECGTPSPDQQRYYNELTESLSKHLEAFKIAYQRRLSGFGIEKNDDKHAKRLQRFYIQLRGWELIEENGVFRGIVIESALGIYQKGFRYIEPHEGCCGIHNGQLLKSILAFLNTEREYKELFNLAIVTEKLSMHLEKLVSGTGYTSPKFNTMKHFNDKC